MKKVLLGATTLICATVVYFAVSPEDSNSYTNILLAQNIEALTQIEQPDVNDCLYDPILECWALHPTDPKKDITRRDSRW